MPKWLNDAVFYEIYPQTFKDTNGDGIGDMNGIIEKLDYIKDLGCNALWLNPCFDSPFKDAGYDVRDYKKIAPRYGTNEDAFRLFEEAHKRDMHVFFDLVPGHTSEEHEWFKQSCKQERNEFSDRYPWTDFCFEGMHSGDYNFIAGEAERSGSYVVNFFKCQPALNYGFLHPTEPWQKPIDDPAAIATREAMKDVMRFWMDHGCDGFRVDMAASLVKNDDEKKTGTSAIWTDVRKMFDTEYPECALVSEWSDPKISIPAGFHMDFLLNNPGTGYSTLLRDYGNHGIGYMKLMGGPGFNGTGEKPADLEDHSFFKKDAGGDIRPFIDEYLDMYQYTKNGGYISMVSCNHDTVRARYTLTDDELKLFYVMLITLPGVPFIYYGDEIGMNYLNIPTKEGGYFRTGSRTPMQWTPGKNHGFSDADPSKLYLPVDTSADAPDVESQLADKDSLLNTIKSLLALRHSTDGLKAEPNLEVVYAEGSVLVYKRGGVLVGINTSSKPASVPVNFAGSTTIFSVGGESAVSNGTLELGGQSGIILA